MARPRALSGLAGTMMSQFTFAAATVAVAVGLPDADVVAQGGSEAEGLAVFAPLPVGSGAAAEELAAFAPLPVGSGAAPEELAAFAPLPVGSGAAPEELAAFAPLPVGSGAAAEELAAFAPLPVGSALSNPAGLADTEPQALVDD